MRLGVTCVVCIRAAVDVSRHRLVCGLPLYVLSSLLSTLFQESTLRPLLQIFPRGWVWGPCLLFSTLLRVTTAFVEIISIGVSIAVC